MKNVILESLLTEGYLLSLDKAREAFAENQDLSDGAVISHTMSILAQTKLPEEFISNYIIYTGTEDLISVIENSQPSEEFLLNEIHHLMLRVIKEYMEGDHSHFYMYLLNKGFGATFYDRLFHQISSFMDSNPEHYNEDAVDHFIATTNNYCKLFSLPFIMENLGDDAFALTSVAMLRDDITFEMMFENIEHVAYNELIFYLNEFDIDDTEEDDEDTITIFTQAKKELLMKVLRAKLIPDVRFSE